MGATIVTTATTATTRQDQQGLGLQRQDEFSCTQYHGGRALRGSVHRRALGGAGRGKAGEVDPLFKIGRRQALIYQSAASLGDVVGAAHCAAAARAAVGAQTGCNVVGIPDQDGICPCHLEAKGNLTACQKLKPRNRESC